MHHKSGTPYSLFAALFLAFTITDVQAASSAQTAFPFSTANLEDRLRHAMDETYPKARLGCAIRNCRNDSLLLQISVDDWFTPASTLKILVTAAALDTFPLNWAPTTTLSLDGVRSGSLFVGQLRVIGGGDPNLSSRYLSNALAIPLAMADSLRQMGIDTVRGLLEADTSRFQGGRRPQGWRKYFFDSWYGAEVSALSFNDNAFLLSIRPGAQVGEAVRLEKEPDVGYVQVINHAVTQAGRRDRITYRLDSAENRITLSGSMGIHNSGRSLVLPVRNPARYFLAALQTAMQQRGLVWIPDSSVQPTPPLRRFSFQTAPLQSILDEVNQRSQNLHAELLLRNLGAFRVHDGTTLGGLLSERLFLRKMGISENDFYLVDGCGLSPENKIKPVATSLLLSRMLRQPRGRLYASSMAQPGITGSTAKRLANLEMAHQIRMKSGFIAGVQGLVGYIGTDQGDSIAVTLYLNGYRGADARARAFLDTLWSWIATTYNSEFAAKREARILWQEADHLPDIQSRIDYFSKRLMGRPYFLGPTGEGVNAPIDPKVRIDFSRFDCVTYLEHVLALAWATAPDSVYAVLQRIRYAAGQIDFAQRNHFFVEDWIGHDTAFVQLARMPRDTEIVREMDKKKFFAEKGLSWEGPNPQTTIPYLPLDRAIALARNWDGPDTLMGIAFVSNKPHICVFHTAILVAHTGEPVRFRHASQISGQVTEQPLAEYLESKRGKTPGVLFFRFKDGTLVNPESVPTLPVESSGP